jgi:hypothetical protein
MRPSGSRITSAADVFDSLAMRMEIGGRDKNGDTGSWNQAFIGAAISGCRAFP